MQIQRLMQLYNYLSGGNQAAAQAVAHSLSMPHAAAAPPDTTPRRLHPAAAHMLAMTHDNRPVLASLAEQSPEEALPKPEPVVIRAPTAAPVSKWAAVEDTGGLGLFLLHHASG